MSFDPTCPVPLRHDTIQLAHGGGGRLMHALIENVFAPSGERHDSAVLDVPSSRLAFTTDTYVVKPRFFPGGNIGKLAVFGTVNDLAMAGAIPRWLSAGFILEEGLAIEELQRIASSMRQAASTCGVTIVTGDTKVVDRGHGDGVFVNTAGIGTLVTSRRIGPSQVQAGDAVLVSGDLGRHGIAVMSAREGIGFRGDIASDCAPLHGCVADLLAGGVDIHCLRDLTRGGLASALNEIARDGAKDVAIDEAHISVSDGVHGACEMLGLDPLYVACEGRMCAIVGKASRDRALQILRDHDAAAAVIGHIDDKAPDRPGRVTIRGALGATRVLDLLSGEQLPRIC